MMSEKLWLYSLILSVADGSVAEEREAPTP